MFRSFEQSKNVISVPFIKHWFKFFGTVEADLDFLQCCQQNNLIPKFLNFKVASSSLCFSRTYKQCQRPLLKEEIKEKGSIISKQKKEFTALKKLIKKKLSIIDFAHICCLFLVGNDKKITKVKEAHCKKLKNLGLVSPVRSHNPDKIIINHSLYQLSDIEKTVLAKGLNFALPPKMLNYADYLTQYKLLFRDIKELSVGDSILERVKVDMKKICLSSFENFKFKDELNITPDELKALKDLSSHKDIIIQKADKGNTVVILNNRDYMERMTEVLSDIDKLKKLNVKTGKELNLVLKHEEKLVSFLKGIKKSIGEDLYKSLYPQGSQPGIMYGSSKIHKPLVNGFPKLRPILSALNTGTYKWAKCFVPLLRHLTSNEFTLKDSFEFAKIICEQDAGLFMVSLDVNSLFTNVPLEETIYISVNELFKSNISIHGLNKKQITKMLSLTTKESIILFDMTFYTQGDGAAMGAPLGPLLANAFLCHHETKWLNDRPKKFKPVFYKRYVGDIFVLFKRPEHVNPFADYMNSKCKNINFSFETEKDGQMPFLDVNVFCENGKSVTNVYRKETFTGVYTNFSSSILLEHKFGLVYTLLNCCFCLISDMSNFHFEIEKLKEILLSNGYSNNFIDKCISKFMNKLYIKNSVMLTVPKKQLYLVLTFMGNMSALVKSGLARSLHKRLAFCTVKIVFKTSNRLKNYFSFKDFILEPLRSCQIYNFTCRSCNASYIGKTFRHLKVRVSEHQGVSSLTVKHLKGILSTSVRDHMLDCNHVVAWDDFKVLGKESNHWLREIKESLFIKRDRLSLNKNIYSQELFLFQFYDVHYRF